MSLQKTNKRIEKLFKEWRELQPLEPEYQEKLDKKIRLEWNYNSNHIEGNTLTYGETVALILEGKEEGIHPSRDYMEMKAHDLAIEKVKEFVADKNRKITEADIRNLNQIILKEPFWKEAETPDGQKTQKEIVPGQYKKQPNHVRTETGEIFKFAEPMEVAPKMQELVDWFNTEIQNPIPSISFFLAELHHRFICIHPFDDGNGRIARLWMNYVLMRLGYPPMVIKSEDKRNYFAALQKADSGDMDTFATYLGNVLVFWLEKGISAAKGESIEDIEDVDKEVELFIRSQEAKGLRTPLTSETFEEIYSGSIQYLFESFIKEFRDWARLFHQTSLEIIPSQIFNPVSLTTINQHSIKDTDNIKLGNHLSLPTIKHITREIHSKKKAYTALIFDYKRYAVKQQTGHPIDISPQSFDMLATLSIHWNEFTYQVEIQVAGHKPEKVFYDPPPVLSKTRDYNDKWTEEEIKEFFAQGKKFFLEAFEFAGKATE